MIWNVRAHWGHEINDSKQSASQIGGYNKPIHGVSALWHRRYLNRQAGTRKWLNSYCSMHEMQHLHHPPWSDCSLWTKNHPTKLCLQRRKAKPSTLGWSVTVLTMDNLGFSMAKTNSFRMVKTNVELKCCRADYWTDSLLNNSHSLVRCIWIKSYAHDIHGSLG